MEFVRKYYNFSRLVFEICIIREQRSLEYKNILLSAVGFSQVNISDHLKYELKTIRKWLFVWILYNQCESFINDEPIFD